MPILSSKWLSVVTSGSNPNRSIFKTRHFLSNQVTLAEVLSSASVTWFLAHPQHNEGSHPAPCPFLKVSPKRVKVVIVLWSKKIVLTWNVKSGSGLKMESECKYHIRHSGDFAFLPKFETCRCHGHVFSTDNNNGIEIPGCCDVFCPLIFWTSQLICQSLWAYRTALFRLLKKTSMGWVLIAMIKHCNIASKKCIRTQASLHDCNSFCLEFYA